MTRTSMWAALTTAILGGSCGEQDDAARDAAPDAAFAAALAADGAALVLEDPADPLGPALVLEDPADPLGPALVLPVPAAIGITPGPVHAVVLSDVTETVPERATGPVQIRPGDDPFAVLPALSADGQLLVSAEETDLGRSLALVWTRARDGKRVRAIDVGYDLERPARRRANRILRRGGYRSMKQLVERVGPEPPDATMPARQRFEGGGIGVHYDPITGGLAVIGEDGRLLWQELIPARLPDFMAVAFEDERHAGERAVPDLYDAAVSPDGRTLWLSFGLCECECLVRPFERVFRLPPWAYP